MKHSFSFSFIAVSCLLIVSISSCEQATIPDDTSGISLDKVNVNVGYTEATIYGTVSVREKPERISHITVHYGKSNDDLSKTADGSYSPTNGFSVDIGNLENGVAYYYRVDIIVGKTAIKGKDIDEFITFPQGPVDLDLPSGLKWGAQNVGANLPTERGNYYAWGETSTKELYTWSTYKYCEGNYDKLTKYTLDKIYSSSGTPDNLVTLQLSDDAAAVNLGTGWRTPTLAEFLELIEHCTITVATINGILGNKVSSKKDMGNNKKFIFIPLYPGIASGTQIDAYGSRYWTSSLYGGSLADQYARVIACMSGSFLTNLHSNRADGLNVRPVYDGE